MAKTRIQSGDSNESQAELAARAAEAAAIAGLIDDDELKPIELELQDLVEDLDSTPGVNPINVFQMIERNGKKELAYVTTYPLETGADLRANLQRDFGGGEFRLQIRNERGSTHPGAFRFNKTITIIKPPNWRPPPPPEDPVDKASAPVLATMAAITESLNKLNARMDAPREGNSRKELLEEMALLKELAGPAAAASSVNPLELFMQGLNFAREILPEANAGAGDGTMNPMRLFELITQAVTGIAQLQNGGAGATPAIAAPASTNVVSIQANKVSAAVAVPGANPGASSPAPQPAAAAAQPGQDEMQKAMAKAIEFLVSQAAADNPVGTSADLILQNVPEEQLRPLVAAPNFIEILAQSAPAVRQHEKWFTALRDDLRAQLAAIAKSASV